MDGLGWVSSALSDKNKADAVLSFVTKGPIIFVENCQHPLKTPSSSKTDLALGNVNYSFRTLES